MNGGINLAPFSKGGREGGFFTVKYLPAHAEQTLFKAGVYIAPFVKGGRKGGFFYSFSKTLEINKQTSFEQSIK